MNDLIEFQYQYDKNNRPLISGLMLHQALGIKTPYRKWFPRICEGRYVVGEDYMTSDIFVRRMDGTISRCTRWRGPHFFSIGRRRRPHIFAVLSSVFCAISQLFSAYYAKMREGRTKREPPNRCKSMVGDSERIYKYKRRKNYCLQTHGP